MYQYLTEVHGITQDKCKHCLSGRIIEVFQGPYDSDEDWASCYECWCKLVHPRIEYKE